MGSLVTERSWPLGRMAPRHWRTAPRVMVKAAAAAAVMEAEGVMAEQEAEEVQLDSVGWDDTVRPARPAVPGAVDGQIVVVARGVKLDVKTNDLCSGRRQAAHQAYLAHTILRRVAW
eukprot:7383711-Prymnesium_polylepis.1